MTYADWYLFGLIVLIMAWMGFSHIQDRLSRWLYEDLRDRVKRLEAERSPWSAADDEDG